MNIFKKLLGLAFLASIILSLPGCNTPIMLDPKGALGIAENKLMIDCVLLMLIIVVPVIIMTLFFAWKYRASNTKTIYSPHWHHSNIVEFFVWGIPIAIVLVIATITWRSTHALDPYKPLQSNKKPIEIQVVALDWKWLFIYPEQNIATVNFVEFPVDTPVSFKLTSDAPMNGFQIVQLGTQIYTMAGMKTRLQLIADETGDYSGRSTNYSGSGFSGMTFVARVTTDADFATWVESVKHSGGTLDANTYYTLEKPSDNNPVTTYASVQNHLFDNIIMKFMMPNMDDLSVDHSNMKM